MEHRETSSIFLSYKDSKRLSENSERSSVVCNVEAISKIIAQTRMRFPG